ncbi:lysozyme inhibitor LprI family protein [Thermocrinis minervae]|uniref:Uncharacterized conserved protein YecT, DUF1311 family n=1 Tax=Thermocrinis minervae TaxID=381751 RepID=A0A1M6SYY2_9AQUI|nr:lysozyme inhibitor LprI family protein [Thermocrinis minervae]SHK49921.1 Uncharacterized conserved protein YecT, DUF1311 family [Thermocrinis minervae]
MRRVFKSLVLVFVLVFVFVVVSFSEEKQEKHPIDVWLEKCIEKDSSTAEMINCSNKAYEMWDKELNRVYQELMKKLSPEEKELLKESQRQWLKFRDAEFRFINQIYGYEGGFYHTQRIGSKIDLVRERVLHLLDYLKEKMISN